MTAPAAPYPTPYVGPRPIRRGEPIYGRDLELHRLSNLIVSERILLLHAPSGAGKSSLLMSETGLLRRLEKKFQILPVIRVNRQPDNPGALPESTNRYALSMLLTLEEAYDGTNWSEMRLARTSLDGYLEKRYPIDPEKRGQLLILDQFEEVFSQDPYDREAKQAFFEQLGGALRNPDRHALVVMRDDYLGALEPYAHQVPTQLRTGFRLDFLDRENALEAIRRPAEEAGVRFDEDAARALVRDLCLVQAQRLDGTTELVEGPYVEPVQLQVVCKRLWERLGATGRLKDGIDLKDVGDAGRVSDALAGYYRDTVGAVVRQTKIDENRLRRWIERELITESGVRGQILRGAKASRKMPNAVISQLVNAHLLRQEERRRAVWFELAHDRLVEPIRKDNQKYREWRTRWMALIVISALLVLAVLFISISSLLAQQQTAAQVSAVQAAFETTSTAQLVQQEVAFQSTSQAQTDQQFTELRQLLTSGVPEDRAAAARSLGIAVAGNLDLISQAAPLLISRLSEQVENDPEVRRAVVDALLQIAEANPVGMARYLVELAPAAADSDAEVRAKIASLLGLAGPAVSDPDQQSLARDTLNRLADDPDENVRAAAAKSLEALPVGIQLEDYLGTWLNTDPETRSVTRVEVTEERAGLNFHLFGSCAPTDCDAGSATVPFTTGPMQFEIDAGFSIRQHTAFLDPQTGMLSVESFIHFTDNSGRADYTSVNTFYNQAQAQGDTAEEPPQASPQEPRPDLLFAALFWEANGLAAIDIDSNQVVRTTRFPGINARYVSGSGQLGLVYVSFANGDTFYAVDALTGELVWSAKEDVGWNSRNSVVSPDGRRVFLATSGGPERDPTNKVLVFDASTGELIQSIRLGTYTFPNGTSRIILSPDGERLAVIDQTAGILFELDVETGDVLSEQPTTSQELLGFASRGDAYYALEQPATQSQRAASGSDMTLLHRINPGGQTQWTLEIDKPYVEKVIARDGVVYVPGSDRVMAVDEGSGRIADRWAVAGPGGMALSADGQRLYVASQNTIIMIDLSTDEQASIPITQGSGPTDLYILPGKQ